jgi:hypothetical protein
VDLIWADLKRPRLDRQELLRRIALKIENTRFDKSNNDPQYWMGRALSGMSYSLVDEDDDRWMVVRVARNWIRRAFFGGLRAVLTEALWLSFTKGVERRALEKLRRATGGGGGGEDGLVAAARSMERVIGATAQCQFAWTMVGALPPDGQLEEIVLSRINTYEACMVTKIVEAGGEVAEVIGKGGGGMHEVGGGAGGGQASTEGGTIGAALPLALIVRGRRR